MNAELVSRSDCRPAIPLEGATEVYARASGQPDAETSIRAGNVDRHVGSFSFRSMAVIFTALLVFCGMLALSWLGLADKPPLRVAINPWPGYEFATLAQEKGYFAEEGIEVRLVELSSVGDVRRAFERGQVDGMFSTVPDVIFSNDQGSRRPQITLVADYSDGADVILAHPDIEGVAALRGKRVAVEYGSLNVVVLAKALSLAGMNWSDVEPVNVPAIEMPRAYADRRVDAAVTYPPTSFEMERKQGLHRIFSSKSIPGVIVDVLAFAEDVVLARPREVAAFHRAFHRAQEYAREHPEEACAIMAARERVTPQDFAAALTEGVRLVYREDQASFLGRDGSLTRNVGIIEGILYDMGQIRDKEHGSLVAQTALER